MYKLVIPSAGIGSRLFAETKHINKALITIGNKPAICHIIDKFDKNIEIIVLVGYKGDYIKQTLKAFYPNRNIIFVDVDKYEGENSGLGYSLLKAKSYLQCPFIFCSNDTIVPFENININPNLEGNWMGYYENINNDVSQYRTLDIKNNYVNLINPKGIQCKNIYIGLCGIQDFKTFWNQMNEHSYLSGETFGLKAIAKIRAIRFEHWYDTGNLENLEKTKKIFHNDEYNILEKEGETIWFSENKVIKFSIDTNFIADRIKRTLYIDNNLIPKITHSDKNIYVYNKVQGKTISKSLNILIFNKMFNLIKEKLWNKQIIDNDIIQNISNTCFDFYQKKTYERIELFFKRFEIFDSVDNINGYEIPKTIDLLNNIDWNSICKDNLYISNFHGDFHNENIILDEENNVVLIDWRQNFGKNNFEFGDIYYDLAKFNHGLIVSHEYVHKNKFLIEKNDNNININIDRPFNLIEIEEYFYKWALNNNFNLEKIKLLNALIFLNVCALHEYPYSLFLYYLGKYYLYKWGIK